MKLIPAIDLKDNKCVRLSKGEDNSSLAYNDKPVEQAIFFEKQGCKRIHIVDIDAAFGRSGINRETILKIRKSVSTPIELGGGIKNKEDILFWLNEGIDYLIIGSLAANEKDLVKAIVKDFKNKIYISLDLLKGKIMIQGWKKSSNMSVKNIINTYDASNIKGYIFTDVSRDGMMSGINIKLISHNLSLTKKPMIIGGGLSNYNDLKNLLQLNSKNLEGIIAGKSFYSGQIDLKRGLKILEEYA